MTPEENLAAELDVRTEKWHLAERSSDYWRAKCHAAEERVKELEGAYKTCPACGKAWVKP